MNLSNDTSSDLTCEESRLIGRKSLDDDTETILRYMTIGFLLLIFPFAIALNSLSIFLIARFKVLHQITFFLALQVVIIDLAVTLFTTPITITTAFGAEWILGRTFCYISSIVVNFLRQTRNWLMFVFVTDRFCTVFFPFRYFKLRKRVIIPLDIGAIAISTIVSFIPLSLDCIGLSRVTWYCSSGSGCTNPEACEIWRATVIVVSNIWGSYLPLVLYIILFVKARKIRNQIMPRDTSQESLEKTKRERKATVTFLFLFLSLFGVSIIPVLFYIVGRSIFMALGVRPPAGYTIFTIIVRTIYNILPIIDPIAIMRNPDVRSAITQLKQQLKIGNRERMANDVPYTSTSATKETTSIN